MEAIIYIKVWHMILIMIGNTESKTKKKKKSIMLKNKIKQKAHEALSAQEWRIVLHKTQTSETGQE